MALVNNPVMGINLRQNKNNKNAGYGKYYPEVDLQKTLTIRGFAQHMIDHGSKYSRGDIENILSMVTECLPELVAQGIPVQLGDLGIFRPTCEAKASVADIAAMEGLNPNEVVKAIHIRFIPNQTKLDNLAGPAFKDQCSLELRNIIDTEKVTVDGKQKSMTTLLPIATAVARLKSGESTGGSPSSGSDTGSGGSSGSDSGGSQGGSQNQPTTYVLSISTSGSGSATVTKNGSAVTSGASLSEDDEVEISITPAEGQVPTASLNGSSIELTESEGVYSGNFAMPGQASSLVINTGSTGGDGGDDLDQG
ncbi:MAG: hypothetical protein J5502_06400 [Prevotella sp.]|nr:hypothetical protein [Prevotella sp.]